MSKILIKNIKGLVQCGEDIPNLKRGKEMKELPILENAFLAIEDGVIVAYGKMEDWGGITDWSCLLYTSPSPRDQRGSRMPSSA